MERKIWWLVAYKYCNSAKSQTSEVCHQQPLFKFDGKFLKAISSLAVQSLQRIRKLFFHPTISKNSSRYGQGCRRVGWSSWLPTSSLVLGWDILLEFSWVSATDILGYIRLLFPCWSVTWFASCAGAMVCVQTNRVSEWYMFILLIQPQSNSLYPDGFYDEKMEWKRAEL